jgi:hypothetical protein
MGSHARADVQQEQDVQWHAFAGKLADRLYVSILAKHEIVDPQIRNDAVRPIDYLSVDSDQGHIGAKHGLTISG